MKMMGLGMGMGIEEVLCELKEDINEQGLPPGFRFHPTDEELITFYLASQVFFINPNLSSSPSIKIAQVDLNRCEPWDLPDVAKMGEREWYFFSLRDRKYPTGLRTNRATGAGYWKATGKDREVHSSSNVLVGMKKTLVFYKGRAPRGEKTRWVMHEYRLDGQLSCRHTCKEEWVICRIFHKIKDKKPPLFQGHNTPSCFLPPCSSLPPTATTGIIPPLPSLLESEPILVQQADLQTQPFPNIGSNINTTPSLSMNALQLPPPNYYYYYYYYMTNTANKKGSKTNGNPPFPSPSNVLIKSFLSNQDPVPIATTISKQCKAEANFSPFLTRPYATNLSWAGQEENFTPFGPGAADHSLPVGTTSASFDFIRAFGSPSAGESWPLDTILPSQL